MNRTRDYYAPDEYVRNWLNSVAGGPEQQQKHHDNHATSQTRDLKRRHSDSLDRQFPAQDGHEVHQAVSRRDLPPVSPDRTRYAVKGPTNDRTKPMSKPGIREEIPAEAESPPAEALDDASRKYARRPRHKTRDDRYEYKDEQTTKKASKKRRTSHKKAGATLNQEFKAPNVESDRLMLKQGAMPGFFGKGKASEPTMGHGIPDLTFSEMTFLSKKRQLDGARFRGLQTVAAKTKRKTNDGAPEISDYFANHAGHENDSRNRRGPSGSSSNRAARYETNNAQGIPRSSIRTCLTRSSNGEDGQQAGSDLGTQLSKRRPNSSAHLDRPHIRMTSKSQSIHHSSDLPWPTSPVRARMHEASEETANADLRDLTSGADPMQSQREMLRAINPQSSVSQATPLMPEQFKHFPTRIWKQQQRAPSLVGRYYYTLDDLKSLAALNYPAECTDTITAAYIGEPHHEGSVLGNRPDSRPPPIIRTITHQDKSKGTVLAPADPCLMAPLRAAFDGTNRGQYSPREKQRIASSWDDHQSQLDSRMEEEHGYQAVHESPLCGLSERTPDLGDAEWRSVDERGLDQFDTALLQATRMSSVASYGREGNQLTADSALLDQGPTQSLITGSIHRGAQNHMWPQLLRAPQEQTEDSTPFSGFNRPLSAVLRQGRCLQWHGPGY